MAPGVVSYTSVTLWLVVLTILRISTFFVPNQSPSLHQINHRVQENKPPSSLCENFDRTLFESVFIDGKICSEETHELDIAKVDIAESYSTVQQTK